MNYRYLAVVGALAVAFSLSQGTALAQAQAVKAETKTAASNWKLPRTSDGRPDLQGVWDNNSATPLERPKELEGRTTLTDQEVAALKKKAAELFGGDGDAAFGDDYFRLVWASVKGSNRVRTKRPPMSSTAERAITARFGSSPATGTTEPRSSPIRPTAKSRP